MKTVWSPPPFLLLCTPGVLYVLTFDFIPSFTRHNKKPAPSSIPSSRYFTNNLCTGCETRDLFVSSSIVLCSARVRWFLKKDRDLSSTSVICLPRHLFSNPQLTNGWMPTVDCHLSRRAPTTQSVVWNRVFLRPPFSQKGEKLGFFLFLCVTTFSSKRIKTRVFFGGAF
jgi:hypothetical protein